MLKIWRQLGREGVWYLETLMEVTLMSFALRSRRLCRFIRPETMNYIPDCLTEGTTVLPLILFGVLTLWHQFFQDSAWYLREALFFALLLSAAAIAGPTEGVAGDPLPQTDKDTLPAGHTKDDGHKH